MNLSSPTRVFLAPRGHLADANAIARYPAERAAWIWHPDRSQIETSVLRFRLRFVLPAAAEPLLHVSADQRFQLRCDGRDVTFGPDRCDPEHWTFQTVRLPLEAGGHELEALVWYIAERAGSNGFDVAPDQPAPPPMAQMSWRGGFLLFGEGVDSSLLTTGEAPWTVEDVTDAVKMHRPWIPFYHDVGPCFTFALDRWTGGEAKCAEVVMPPVESNPHGVRRSGWCLYPADLQEQRRESWTGGRVRAFRSSWSEGPVLPSEIGSASVADWQELVASGRPLVLAPHTECTIFWDLETYRCGYPGMTVEGGAGAAIEWSWAEALYEEPDFRQIGEKSSKGNRNIVEGKVFLGIEDRWEFGAAARTDTPALWWRCGRHVRVRVRTADAPLTLVSMGLVTTGYPLDVRASWKSSEPEWDRLMPLFENAYRIAAHETWTDTPYYEQMCYVGDNVPNAVSNYAWFGDARLSRRSIELFAWSRHASGLVAERYPSGWRQESPTFSLLWPTMVRDYAWWRDDAPFIRSLLPGLRGVLAEFDGFAAPDGLLHEIPGWPFVDWVPGWATGCGPGVRGSDSSIVNLHWVRALLAAAEVEQAYGDALIAARHRTLAGRVMDRLLARYWDEKRALLLDTPGHAAASEHAQMFALLTGLLDAKKTAGCLAALRREDLARATIYASFYLLDAFYRHGEEAAFHERLRFWRGLPAQGFTATPEAPEPTRSDSHPWGAHPAFHTLASIAGVRPDGPGFSRVRVAPLPGPIDRFEARVVHPRGLVEVDFRRDSAACAFRVDLPEGVTGALVFRGGSRELQPGKNEFFV
jgi:hypothetical protein